MSLADGSKEVAKTSATELSEIGASFDANSFDWAKVKPHNLINKCMDPARFAKATAGKILTHCTDLVTSLRQRVGLRVCIFKVGVSSNPPQRFSSYVEQGYTVMWVLAASPSTDLIHTLEAALVSQFHMHVGCRNAAGSGGEGALCRPNRPDPPYFLYVVGARADQPRSVGG